VVTGGMFEHVTVTEQAQLASVLQRCVDSLQSQIGNNEVD
jgi:hypothetical protein